MDVMRLSVDARSLNNFQADAPEFELPLIRIGGFTDAKPVLSKRLGFFPYAERMLGVGAGVVMAVRKECVGRGLAMWIAWVAAGPRQRVGREIGPKRWSTASD